MNNSDKMIKLTITMTRSGVTSVDLEVADNASEHYPVNRAIVLGMLSVAEHTIRDELTIVEKDIPK